MMTSSVPSNRDLRWSESVRPTKPNIRSDVTLAEGIVWNWRVITVIRGNGDCPTSLHQTTISWVMSDPSSFLSITVLLWISHRHLQSVLYFQSCFVRFRYLWWHVSCWRHGLLRRYDPAQQTTTIRRHTKLECDHNTRKERDPFLLFVRKLDMETLETDGVNEMFVVVTVDVSFTTEQVASGSLGTHRTRGSNSQTQILSPYRAYSQWTRVLWL